MTEHNKIIRVGSRKSELALIQTKYVIDQLKEIYPDKEFEITSMNTIGDKILDTPLTKIGEKNLFTKELEIALELKEVDFVVHSLKDLPTTLPAGMVIGAVLKREDPRDAVIIKQNVKEKTLETLPRDSVIGTSSLRRGAQLTKTYPHLTVESIRGNLNTRMKKLEDGNLYSGIILAAAGVKRMNWQDKITYMLEPDVMMYAIGQGALAVECCQDNLTLLKLLEPLNHKETVVRTIAERSFLSTLGGGCTAPVAVHSTLENNNLSLTGAVWSLNGADSIKESRQVLLQDDNLNPPPRKIMAKELKVFTGISSGSLDEEDLTKANELGKELANIMNKLGADKIMLEAKETIEKSILKKPKVVNNNMTEDVVSISS